MYNYPLTTCTNQCYNAVTSIRLGYFKAPRGLAPLGLKPRFGSRPGGTMRTISVSNFRQNISNELEDLPVKLTKWGRTVAVVLKSELEEPKFKKTPISIFKVEGETNEEDRN